MIPFPDRDALFTAGVALAERFCRANSLLMPPVVRETKAKWAFPVCAFYRPVRLHLCVEDCAAIGTDGRQWSYPGYAVDRTPVGVIAHEIGHHADWSKGFLKGRYWSEYGAQVRAVTGEAALTSYEAGKDHEWFAEMARLFITNPDLLRLIRPATHARLLADGWVPVVEARWDQVLQDAPERTRAAARSRIEDAVKKTARTAAAQDKTTVAAGQMSLF